jgi:hypothetical protein
MIRFTFHCPFCDSAVHPHRGEVHEGRCGWIGRYPAARRTDDSGAPVLSQQEA